MLNNKERRYEDLMKEYRKYIKDVKEGKVITCTYIKQAVERFERMCADDRYFFDEKCVDEAIEFISKMKHFLGKSAGKPFMLEPWQQFLIANILGVKWKDTKLRVCRNVYLQVARKAGKDALIAALCLYLMIADGEMSAECYALSNSKDQSRILFDYVTNFAKSLDPKGTCLDYYRNYVKMPSTNSKVEVLSSDSAVLDGKNPQISVCDEFHEFKDRKLLDVMVSGMGMRTQPMSIIITTAGFDMTSPCHDMYMLGIETLAGVKEDDSSMYFLYVLDDGDDWTDSKNWIKVQPNLGVTVTEEFMRTEVQKAKNDPTALNGILVKTFNCWTQSNVAWISPEKVVKCMDTIDWDSLKGQICYMGVDLSSVNDLTSLSLLIPYNGKYYFKAYGFLPEATLENHPNKEVYKKFIREGDLIITTGNIVDFDYVTKKIMELNQQFSIEGIYYDPYNSGTWSIQCTELGLNMQPYSQGLLHFNNPTRQMEKWIIGGDAIIDKSSLFLWCIQNVALKEDWNNNRKPVKAGANAKIDPVIASIMATGGYLKNPNDGNMDFIFIS